jgi:hypothetical protein
MTANWQWAVLVAAAFDAGRPVAPLTRVDGGISHAVFQLQTTTGRYAAKRLNVVAERCQARAATECLARLRGAAKSLHRIPEWTGWLTALQ